jgi:hypothetical protein
VVLTHLNVARDEYTTCRYEEAFDWTALLAALNTLAEQLGRRWKRREYYIVEFRSKLKERINVDLLYKLDKESHSEANQSGGLFKYWYGSPDSERRNLATCKTTRADCTKPTDRNISLWRSKEEAVMGGRGSWHKQARTVIPQMYEKIDVKGLRLVIEDDMRDWQFS